MTEEDAPAATALGLHEEFIEHIEQGAAKIKALALITVVVAALLAIGFLTQLLLPLATGQGVVQVNLADPALEVFELLLLALTVLWLYVGGRDYLFMRRLSKQIAAARTQEQELFKKAGLS